MTMLSWLRNCLSAELCTLCGATWRRRDAGPLAAACPCCGHGNAARQEQHQIKDGVHRPAGRVAGRGLPS